MTTICKVNTTLRAIIKNNKKYMEQIKVAKISLKVNTKKSTIEKKEIYNYLSQLDEHNKQAYLIAYNHLGTSFNILKSNGYKEWINKKN